MSKKFTTPKKSNVTLYGPNTKKSVNAGPGTQVPIPNDKATWWNCPECNELNIEDHAICEYCGSAKS